MTRSQAKERKKAPNKSLRRGSVKSSKPQPKETDQHQGNIIQNPNPHDVVFGRAQTWPGNINYRFIVRVHQKEFHQMASKDAKKRVAEKVVREIASLDPPGRFLVPLGEKDKGYVEAEKSRAAVKTYRALHEIKETKSAEFDDFLKKRNASRTDTARHTSTKSRARKVSDIDAEHSDQKKSRTAKSKPGMVRKSPRIKAVRDTKSLRKKDPPSEAIGEGDDIQNSSNLITGAGGENPIANFQVLSVVSGGILLGIISLKDRRKAAAKATVEIAKLQSKSRLRSPVKSPPSSPVPTELYIAKSSLSILDISNVATNDKLSSKERISSRARVVNSISFEDIEPESLPLMKETMRQEPKLSDSLPSSDSKYVAFDSSGSHDPLEATRSNPPHFQRGSIGIDSTTDTLNGKPWLVSAEKGHSMTTKYHSKFLIAFSPIKRNVGPSLFPSESTVRYGKVTPIDQMLDNSTSESKFRYGKVTPIDQMLENSTSLHTEGRCLQHNGQEKETNLDPAIEEGNHGKGQVDLKASAVCTTKDSDGTTRPENFHHSFSHQSGDQASAKPSPRRTGGPNGEVHSQEDAIDSDKSSESLEASSDVPVDGLRSVASNTNEASRELSTKPDSSSFVGRTNTPEPPSKSDDDSILLLLESPKFQDDCAMSSEDDLAPLPFKPVHSLVLEHSGMEQSTPRTPDMLLAFGSPNPSQDSPCVKITLPLPLVPTCENAEEETPNPGGDELTFTTKS